ncbi:dTMP kinase [Thermoproteus tenax]|uniref:Probable thymidylate kinase n=1 Tax=Thermoproteus tenax (strain ATCC 35583 / DSM 2078 / JCM 9277 / NBRC 100435 / Kra 1) TaxID=768679 RepID=G4RPD7_THETK|nr:dTMP kinase [Thermoproteus tenax]CCC81432.1 Thymidylate kinase [Thermoproteus tenax Kra 1]
MIFIAIEGIDGSGKSTVISLLREMLGIYATKEPSSGPIGRLIKEWSLKGGTQDPYVDALLFAADRLDHYQREIAPALAKGYIVVTERYIESSIAYQGAAGVDIGFIELVNSRVRRPDLTIILDIDPSKALERVRFRGTALEKYEKIEFLRRVRAIYLDRAAKFGYAVLDADRGPREVAEDVARLVRATLSRARGTS